MKQRTQLSGLPALPLLSPTKLQSPYPDLEETQGFGLPAPHLFACPPLRLHLQCCALPSSSHHGTLRAADYKEALNEGQGICAQCGTNKHHPSCSYIA